MPGHEEAGPAQFFAHQPPPPKHLPPPRQTPLGMRVSPAPPTPAAAGPQQTPTHMTPAVGEYGWLVGWLVRSLEVY